MHHIIVGQQNTVYNIKIKYQYHTCIKQLFFEIIQLKLMLTIDLVIDINLNEVDIKI